MQKIGALADTGQALTIQFQLWTLPGPSQGRGGWAEVPFGATMVSHESNMFCSRCLLGAWL